MAEVLITLLQLGILTLPKVLDHLVDLFHLLVYRFALLIYLFDLLVENVLDALHKPLSVILLCQFLDLAHLFFQTLFGLTHQLLHLVKCHSHLNHLHQLIDALLESPINSGRVRELLAHLCKVINALFQILLDLVHFLTGCFFVVKQIRDVLILL